VWCLANVAQYIEETDCNFVVVVIGGLLFKDVVLLEFRELQVLFPQEICSQLQGNGC
jgi:hypothetical protein